MSNPQKTCVGAVAGLQRLRGLARETGFPPSGDAALGRLIAAVETAADAVRAHADEVLRAEADRNQLGLF